MFITLIIRLSTTSGAASRSPPAPLARRLNDRLEKLLLPEKHNIDSALKLVPWEWPIFGGALDLFAPRCASM